MHADDWSGPTDGCMFLVACVGYMCVFCSRFLSKIDRKGEAAYAGTQGVSMRAPLTPLRTFKSI